MVVLFLFFTISFLVKHQILILKDCSDERELDYFLFEIIIFLFVYYDNEQRKVGENLKSLWIPLRYMIFQVQELLGSWTLLSHHGCHFPIKELWSRKPSRELKNEAPVLTLKVTIGLESLMRANRWSIIQLDWLLREYSIQDRSMMCRSSGLKHWAFIRETLCCLAWDCQTQESWASWESAHHGESWSVSARQCHKKPSRI